MRANRVSISRLAEMSDISKATMQNYIYGMRDPRLSLCRRLVELTGIPFEELFKEK
ncbi:helix-turn-helix domain-containing protein [Agathobaculum faecis]|nr:helix-turn-helix transcriptional regulator [Agathobaculum faecis]